MKTIIIVCLFACLVSGCKKQTITEHNTLVTESNVVDTIATDSLRIEYIDDTLVVKIKPAINKWLQYYKLDITKFKKEAISEMNVEKLKNDTTYPYYNYILFTKEHDVYLPQFYDYSPDKMKYINILEASVVYRGDDGKYYYNGSDDSQGISLFDRRDKSSLIISYRGFSDGADGVFWVDNDMFVIAGYATYNDSGEFTLEIFDLKKNTKVRYILPKEHEAEDSYLMDDMKKRRVIMLDRE